jgi:hypothetical protein
MQEVPWSRAFPADSTLTRRYESQPANEAALLMGYPENRSKIRNERLNGIGCGGEKKEGTPDKWVPFQSEVNPIWQALD